MEENVPFVSLAVAVGCGLLIGLQREQAAGLDGQAESERLGGIRTYPLYALAGALCAQLAPQTGVIVPALVFIVLMAPVLIAYGVDVFRDRARGITTESAFAIAFIIGAIAATEGVAGTPTRRWLLALVSAVITMALLELKDPLHKLAARISRDEMVGAVKFLIFAVMLVPHLPNRAVGPLGAINPFKMGLLVVLMAAISAVGYVAVRVLGPGRGLSLAGLVGGLVSSTAVTLASASRSRREPGVSRACALAVVLACNVMVVRVMVEVGVVNTPLLGAMAWPLGAMLCAGVAASGWLYAGTREPASSDEPLEVTNPFEMGSALKLAGLFATVQLVAKVAQQSAGAAGLYAAAALSGLTDVDAITLSLAELATGSLDQAIAARGILIAVGTNTLVKAGMALWLGSATMGRTVAAALAAMIVAGWVVP